MQGLADAIRPANAEKPEHQTRGRQAPDYGVVPMASFWTRRLLATRSMR
jgi:hypothetical protein